MAIDSSFIDFVNNEIPRRISTKVDPMNAPADHMIVSTGLGLEVKFEPLPSGSNLGLITDTNLLLDSNGKAVLTKAPKGDILLNMAIVFLKDGSYIEVSGVEVVDERYLQLLPEDYQEIKDDVTSVTVSYIGNL